MKPQLSSRRQTASDDVDIDALTTDELRAYIAGLRERRQALICRRCDGSQCEQCSQLRSAYRYPPKA